MPLKLTGNLWLFQTLNIPLQQKKTEILAKSLQDPRSATQTYDERNRVAVGRRSSGFLLIVLVVHEKVLLVLRVDRPSLVCVRGSRVGCARNDGRRLAGFADLVCGIVDGQSVLVVAVADVTTVVLLVRAAVFDALISQAWSVMIHEIRSTGGQRTCASWTYPSCPAHPGL